VTIKMTPTNASSRLVIQGYSGAGYRVGGEAFAGGVLILPDRAIAWPYLTLAEVAADPMDAFADIVVLEGGLDVLLLGTGAGPQLLPKPLREALSAHAVPVDAMDSRAAARTYNVLLAEGRRIAAALLPHSAA
jgi:uncharacterized protein